MGAKKLNIGLIPRSRYFLRGITVFIKPLLTKHHINEIKLVIKCNKNAIVFLKKIINPFTYENTTF